MAKVDPLELAEAFEASGLAQGKEALDSALWLLDKAGPQGDQLLAATLEDPQILREAYRATLEDALRQSLPNVYAAYQALEGEGLRSSEALRLALQEDGDFPRGARVETLEVGGKAYALLAGGEEGFTLPPAVVVEVGEGGMRVLGPRERVELAQLVLQEGGDSVEARLFRSYLQEEILSLPPTPEVGRALLEGVAWGAERMRLALESDNGFAELAVANSLSSFQMEAIDGYGERLPSRLRALAVVAEDLAQGISPLVETPDGLQPRREEAGVDPREVIEAFYALRSQMEASGFSLELREVNLKEGRHWDLSL